MIAIAQLLSVDDVFFVQEFAEAGELFVTVVQAGAVGAVEGADYVGVVG